MKVIERDHQTKSDKRFGRHPKMIKYIEFTDRDFYDFSNPIFKMANRLHYEDGNTYINDKFDNDIVKKFSNKAYELVGKRESKYDDNKLKILILHETTKAIAKLMIENDDTVNLLDGKIILQVGYKEKYKKLDLSTMLRVQNTPYPLVEILHDDHEKRNVFMQMEFTMSMRRLFNKYKNLRSYARKRFVHNT